MSYTLAVMCISPSSLMSIETVYEVFFALAETMNCARVVAYISEFYVMYVIKCAFFIKDNYTVYNVSNGINKI